MSNRPALRLGTRGSDLARTQSGTVAAALERLGFTVELTIIKTSGDQNTTALFGSIGPQGVFVREIEQALVERRIELAVQCRRDDAHVLAALAELDHAPSRSAVTAEREALARAEGGCDVAFGAYCFADGGTHELRAMLERGGVVRSASAVGNPAALAAEVWAKLDGAAP